MNFPGVSVVRWICLVFAFAALSAHANEPFALRGYYITFMRMPTMGLVEWKAAVDCIREDGGNTLILWVAGGFRSEKFPATWQYNRDHKNVRKDFVRKLIDHAHRKKIKVLLGFTPFAYDGVNQFPLEHPELKATQQDGAPARLWGMHSWGYNLCPSKTVSQEFMLQYAREMFFDFYPNSDGLLIESSDYAICYCEDCRGHFFEKEFSFVKKISDEVWRAKPDAMIVVFPHYFSSRTVPEFNVGGAQEKFDPRWTLVFTPHSARMDAGLIRAAKSSIWWNDAPALHTWREIRDGARRAAEAGMSGYVPSLEAFCYKLDHTENGEPALVGKQLKPFGFPWLRDGEMPYRQLPVRVNRIAYREFTRDPNLGEDEFKKILAREIFGADKSLQAADDLLFLQQTLFLDRDWWTASPLVSPELLKSRAARGNWSKEKLSDYRARLERIRKLEADYRGSKKSASRELRRIAEWICDAWDSEEGRSVAKELW